MRKLAMTTAAALFALAAVCAWGYRFVEERFEGRWPPPGWEIKTEGTGRWYQINWGPWGRYASGYVAGNDYSNVDLISKVFRPGGNKSLYYHFDARHPKNWNPNATAWFYLYYYDDPPAAFHMRLIVKRAGWQVISGTVKAELDRPVRAIFNVHGVPYADAKLDVDNVIIMDREPEPAVSPASLGRVKALFK